MSVVTITKSLVQRLVDEGKRGSDLADALGIPKSKVKEAIKALNIKVPRASKGGTIFQFVDDTITFTEDAPMHTSVLIVDSAPTEEPAF